MKEYDVSLVIRVFKYTVHEESEESAADIAVEELYNALTDAHLGNFSVSVDGVGVPDDDDDDDKQLEEEDQWNGPKQ